MWLWTGWSLYIELQRQPATAGIDAHNGATQTTDAFYRETTAEINYYTADDVLTIEMKIASLFTITQYRDIIPGAISLLFSPGPGFLCASHVRSPSQVCLLDYCENRQIVRSHIDVSFTTVDIAGARNSGFERKHREDRPSYLSLVARTT
ncbi:hypothetical protein [Halomicrococcus sp. NG-SE-24]|uniref:phosphorylase family protein n=1 Tax=Halomicrococcus sp. NG-SE-24 TaxID=3436928 RepID=UPI003D97EB0E